MISSITPVSAKSTIADWIDSRSLYVGKTTEMRQPRHATPLRLSAALPAEAPRLSAELPAEALARDEALLDEVAVQRRVRVRWYTPSAPAVVLGLGLRHRRAAVVDDARCRAAGVAVLERRAGGGAVLLEPGLVCAAVCLPLPDARAPDDMTASYRWLGERFAAALGRLGVEHAQRVEVEQARADVHGLRARAAAAEPVARLLLDACYGALSPHEVLVAPPGARPRKLVGLAQVRRRQAALFQVGLLRRDQSALADLLAVPDESVRAALRAALGDRTTGLEALLPAPLDLDRIAQVLQAAFDDALESA